MYHYIVVRCIDILQKIFQNIEASVLTVALKGVNERLTNKLLSCLSKRAAESVREEISFLGAIKPKQIEAAQGQIIEAVRKLESEGEIDLDEMRMAHA